jgi:hypothetical protein
VFIITVFINVSKVAIAFFFRASTFLRLLEPEDEDITIIRRVGKYLSVDNGRTSQKT